MQAFDPGLPVLDRTVEKHLKRTVLSRRERIVLTECRDEESDADCQQRGDEAAREKYPNPHELSVELRSEDDGARTAIATVLIDPGMTDVVEELRLVLVVRGEGAGARATLERRAAKAGLTASVFEPEKVGASRAIISCARPRR